MPKDHCPQCIGCELIPVSEPVLVVMPGEKLPRAVTMTVWRCDEVEVIEFNREDMFIKDGSR